jgi:hypothetical protein
MFSTTNYQNEHLPQKISIKELSDELLGLLESVPQKS